MQILKNVNCATLFIHMLRVPNSRNVKRGHVMLFFKNYVCTFSKQVQALKVPYLVEHF